MSTTPSPKPAGPIRRFLSAGGEAAGRCVAFLGVPTFLILALWLVLPACKDGPGGVLVKLLAAVVLGLLAVLTAGLLGFSAGLVGVFVRRSCPPRNPALAVSAACGVGVGYAAWLGIRPLLLGAADANVWLVRVVAGALAPVIEYRLELFLSLAVGVVGGVAGALAAGPRAENSPAA